MIPEGKYDKCILYVSKLYFHKFDQNVNFFVPNLTFKSNTNTKLMPKIKFIDPKFAEKHVLVSM